MRVINLGSVGAAGVIGSAVDMAVEVDGQSAQMVTMQSLVTKGAPSAVTLDIEGSLDNVNWFVLDNHIFSAGELTADGAMYHMVDKPVKYLRANVTTLTVAASTAQIDTVDTFVAVDSTLYTVTIGGIAFDYTSDADATIAEIVAGLVAEINTGETNGSVPVTAADVASTSITLTADVAGEPFTASINGNMSISTTTANVDNRGIVDAQIYVGK